MEEPAAPSAQVVESAAPSAQIVGQEFVKQYYTMLNAAPEHLHRYRTVYTHQ